MKNYDKCPVCEHSSFKPYLECKDYTTSQEKFKIVECNNCGFAFTNPIPLENKIGEYYESSDYISHSNTSKGIINTLYQIVRNITLNRKVNLIKSLSKGKKILDIGSGTGEFLNACKKSNLTVEGIEPSELGRKKSKENYGLEVYDESSLDAYNDKTFDYISLWHVLEHVYHLNSRIETIRRILKDDGHLIVAVPNRNSFDAEHYKEFWAAYDVPRHLYHFTPKDIELLFNKHHFEVIKVLPMKFDSFYVSMLSEKYKLGKGNILNAFRLGLKSNFKGVKNKTYSSQIYIIKKAK